MACIWASFVGFAPGAWSQDVVDKPQVKPGDNWAYNRIDNWKRQVEFAFAHEVTGVGDGEIRIKVTRRDNGQVFQNVYSDQWNQRGGVQNITPEYNWLQFPLQAGKKYRMEYATHNRQSGVQTKNQREVEVTGWEEVTVPAGKFRALKIVTSGTYTRLDRPGSGRVRETFWYAPEVRRWVRTEYEDTDFSGNPYNRSGVELIEFKLQ
jgi:hypothetical protein